MRIEKLLAAKQKLDEQIKQAELAAKHKNRTERLALKLLNKYPALFLCDPKEFEKSLDTALKTIAANLAAAADKDTKAN